MDENVAKAELLLYYIKRGDLGCVQAMIIGGADVNARSSDSSPMLLEAVGTHDVGVVRLLLAAGADASADCYDGRTPLGRAVDLANIEMAKALIAAGADPKADRKGRAPLVLTAVSNRSSELVEVLIAAGADVNAANSMGDTPLLEAVSRNDLEMCRRLTKAGAGPAREYETSAGENVYLSPFQMALRRGYAEIAWLLFEHFEEDPSQTTVRGVTMDVLAANTSDTRELLGSIKVAHALRSGIGAADEHVAPRAPQGFAL